MHLKIAIANFWERKKEKPPKLLNYSAAIFHPNCHKSGNYCICLIATPAPGLYFKKKDLWLGVTSTNYRTSLIRCRIFWKCHHYDFNGFANTIKRNIMWIWNSDKEQWKNKIIPQKNCHKSVSRHLSDRTLQIPMK